MNKQTAIKEFREKFVDHWEGLGQAVVYPIKEGVSSIIPADDLEQFISDLWDKAYEAGKQDEMEQSALELEKAVRGIA